MSTYFEVIQPTLGFACTDNALHNGNGDGQHADLMDVETFLQECPEFRMSGGQFVLAQERIFERAILEEVPEELRPSYPYVRSSRARRNFNNTLTHAQCPKCRRVVRNDRARFTNGLYMQLCMQCQRERDADIYRVIGPIQTQRRIEIWSYLAPICVGCGRRYPPKIMHMHHVGDKRNRVSALVQGLAAKQSHTNAERLAVEANRCVPLCPNCHALRHHGDLDFLLDYAMNYQASELLRIASRIEGD